MLVAKVMEDLNAVEINAKISSPYYKGKMFSGIFFL